MECCKAGQEYTDDDGNMQECCIRSYVTCAKKLLEGQKSIHWSNNDRKKRGAPKDFPHWSNWCQRIIIMPIKWQAFFRSLCSI